MVLRVKIGSVYRTLFSIVLTAIFTATFFGCGGGGGGEGGVPAAESGPAGTSGGGSNSAASTIVVSVDPAEATLMAKGSQTFSAKVEGGEDLSVIWSVQEASGGTINEEGTYTAPTAAGTYHVIATSRADSNQNAVITVNVTEEPVVSVAISPTSLGIMTRGKKKFTAAVSGTDDKEVTWRIEEGGAGGAIDPAGGYTAPNSYGVYHIVATSRADPTKTARATVQVQLCNAPRRNPYLARLSSTSAVIAWRCRPEGKVQWGEEGALDTAYPDNIGQDQHFVTLKNLEPATTYSYEVVVEGERLAQPATFKTAPDSGTDFSFIAFADSGSGDIHQARIAQLMKGMSFEFAILAGDIIYDKGADFEYDSRYFQPYRGLINHLPFFTVPGNHDVVTEAGRPYRKNFYLPQGTFYHDFFWGEAHFIGLDSNKVEDPKQREWLINALKAPARWKIVYFHHPAFSSGHYGGYPTIQKGWVPLFERYGVDLVVTGHAHNYERTDPINGVTYIVTGGGGAPLYPVGSNDFTAFSLSAHHLVSIHLSNDQLDLKALDETGTILDTFTKNKSERPAEGNPGSSFPNG